MNTQYYVLEMRNFTKKEAESFLGEALASQEYEDQQLICTSHLTEKGVTKLKKCVFAQEVTD